jgi:hypothetical protein
LGWFWKRKHADPYAPPPDFRKLIGESDISSETLDKLRQLSGGKLPPDLRLKVMYPLPGKAAFYINDHNVERRLFDWALLRQDQLKQMLPQNPRVTT